MYIYIILKGCYEMGNWNYEDLSDDVEELARNLLQMNEKNLKKTEKSAHNLKLDKSEKRLHKTVKNIFGR